MDRLTTNMHPFLNESTITALYGQEIFTAKDFIFCEAQHLSKISLLVFKEILEIKRCLVRKYAAPSENAYDSYRLFQKNSAIIPSGVERIDKFLEGGLLTSNIYEICGPAASGKTLFAYTFMKNLVLKMNQNCFFLDAKNDFSANKFSLLCKGYSNEEILSGLSHIFVTRIKTKYDLVNSLQEIADKLDNNLQLRLIVIDSLAAVILDSNSLSQNNLILNHIANLLHYITFKHHVVIIVINLVTTWVEGDFSTQLGTKARISCGRFWYTVPNTRIKFETDGGKMEISVEKSNVLSLSSVTIPSSDIIPVTN